MKTSFNLFSSRDCFMIHFGSGKLMSSCEVTSINGLDKNGRLFFSEIQLFEETRISIAPIREQFKASYEIEVSEYGQLFINYRMNESLSHANGFGRNAKIAIDTNGKIIAIEIAWNAPLAGTPFVDRDQALKGLDYRDGNLDDLLSSGVSIK